MSVLLRLSPGPRGSPGTRRSPAVSEPVFWEEAPWYSSRWTRDPRVTARPGWTRGRREARELACRCRRMPCGGAAPGTAWHAAGAGGTGNLLNWSRRVALPHPRAGAGWCRHLALVSPARSPRSTVSALGTKKPPLGLQEPSGRLLPLASPVALPCVLQTLLNQPRAPP